jgi:predicted nicotinamide N-methyase
LSARPAPPARRPLPAADALDKLQAHLHGLTTLAGSVVRIGDRSYRITHPASADALIDEYDFDHNERLPYWAELWPSAISLALHLYERNLAGTRAIELGCGVGLPTVAALNRGARVLATDHYEAALDFTAHNARANLGQEPETALLDWRAPDVPHPAAFDLVVGADVLYERPNAVALADLVPKLLAPEGEAIFADPRRDDAPAFVRMMEEKGFETCTQDTSVHNNGREVRVLLHQLRRK